MRSPQVGGRFEPDPLAAIERAEAEAKRQTPAK